MSLYTYFLGNEARCEEARCGKGAAEALLDARSAEDFAAGHLTGARSMPYSFTTPPTAADVAALTAFRRVIVYCDTPEDAIAMRLAEQLRQAGLKQVAVLRHGAEALGAQRGGDAR